MTHVLDEIVEQMRSLLINETAAMDRVTRDRSPRRPFQGRTDLPAIDIRVAEDNPQDGPAQSVWRSEAVIHVDLYTYAAEVDASREVLSLRAEMDRALMVDMPRLPGAANVIRILRGGAEPIVREDSGQLPIAYCRCTFFVTYQHAQTDPTA